MSDVESLLAVLLKLRDYRTNLSSGFEVRLRTSSPAYKVRINIFASVRKALVIVLSRIMIKSRHIATNRLQSGLDTKASNNFLGVVYFWAALSSTSYSTVGGHRNDYGIQ